MLKLPKQNHELFGSFGFLLFDTVSDFVLRISQNPILRQSPLSLAVATGPSFQGLNP